MNHAKRVFPFLLPLIGCDDGKSDCDQSSRHYDFASCMAEYKPGSVIDMPIWESVPYDSYVSPSAMGYHADHDTYMDAANTHLSVNYWLDYKWGNTVPLTACGTSWRHQEGMPYAQARDDLGDGIYGSSLPGFRLISLDVNEVWGPPADENNTFLATVPRNMRVSIYDGIGVSVETDFDLAPSVESAHGWQWRPPMTGGTMGSVTPVGQDFVPYIDEFEVTVHGSQVDLTYSPTYERYLAGVDGTTDPRASHDQGRMVEIVDGDICRAYSTVVEDGDGSRSDLSEMDGTTEVEVSSKGFSFKLSDLEVPWNWLNQQWRSEKGPRLVLVWSDVVSPEAKNRNTHVASAQPEEDDRVLGVKTETWVKIGLVLAAYVVGSDGEPDDDGGTGSAVIEGDYNRLVIEDSLISHGGPVRYGIAGDTACSPGSAKFVFIPTFHTGGRAWVSVQATEGTGTFDTGAVWTSLPAILRPFVSNEDGLMGPVALRSPEFFDLPLEGQTFQGSWVCDVEDEPMVLRTFPGENPEVYEVDISSFLPGVGSVRVVKSKGSRNIDAYEVIVPGLPAASPVFYAGSRAPNGDASIHFYGHHLVPRVVAGGLTIDVYQDDMFLMTLKGEQIEVDNTARFDAGVNVDLLSVEG